jgi:phosphinothricin acetyltransferase
LLRHADPERDGAACAAIYEPFVRDTAVSFETEPPDAAEMGARIRAMGESHPWLVAERDGVVVGFAYATTHRTRAAYRWAADVAVYVDADHRRNGVGRELYIALLELLRRQRLRVACAGITLPNDASVALHESLGFELVGVYRAIGWKARAWRDVGWWQLELSAAGPGAPEEPLRPQRLDET